MKRRPKPAAPTPTPPTVKVSYYAEAPFGLDWEGKVTYRPGGIGPDDDNLYSYESAARAARYRTLAALRYWRAAKKKGNLPHITKPLAPHRIVRETVIREVMP